MTVKGGVRRPDATSLITVTIGPLKTAETIYNKRHLPTDDGKARRQPARRNLATPATHGYSAAL